MLVRDVLASSIERIVADRVLEEKLSIHHIDLYYRPVYAFRYRWQGKEAVVEFDGVCNFCSASVRRIRSTDNDLKKL